MALQLIAVYSVIMRVIAAEWGVHLDLIFRIVYIQGSFLYYFRFSIWVSSFNPTPNELN
jgi:hypothetical protein